MKPSREAFEEALVNFASDYSALEEAFLHGDSDVHERRAEKAKSKAAVLDVYEAQEAQIRELADALEAVLDNVPTCVFVDAYPWDGRCGTHDFTVQEPGKCAIQRAVDVLARTRGES